MSASKISKAKTRKIDEKKMEESPPKRKRGRPPKVKPIENETKKIKQENKETNKENKKVEQSVPVTANSWRKDQPDRYKLTLFDERFALSRKKFGQPIYIIDAVMGTGKTLSAINKINDDHSNRPRYLYITPYLTEVQRIIQSCPDKHFKEPTTEHHHSKMAHFLELLHNGENIVCSHALFLNLKLDDLNEVWNDRYNYNLFIDEAMDLFHPLPISQKELRLMGMGNPIEGKVGAVIKIEKNGRVVWIGGNRDDVPFKEYKPYIQDGYTVGYSSKEISTVDLALEYIEKVAKEDKELIESYINALKELQQKNDWGETIQFPQSIMWNFHPDIFKKFSKIYVMTYIFEGYFHWAYFKCHNFAYKYLHIQKEEIIDKDTGVVHIDYNIEPFIYDEPQTFDLTKYQKLIHIIGNDRQNSIGERIYPEKGQPLTKHWYDEKLSNMRLTLAKALDKKPNEITEAELVAKPPNAFNKLHNNMKAIFSEYHVTNNKIMWTTFTEYKPYIQKDRYGKQFVPLNLKASNEFRNRQYLAYLVNRYSSVSTQQFLKGYNAEIDEDKFALAEMLQWIFRSAIRDGKEIWIYIPSIRMRNLLRVWMGLEPEQTWDEADYVKDIKKKRKQNKKDNNKDNSELQEGAQEEPQENQQQKEQKKIETEEIEIINEDYYNPNEDVFDDDFSW